MGIGAYGPVRPGLCPGSLWMRRPLMYSFAVEFIGPGTARGREMISL
jgi:hypothetical protein